MGCFVAFGVDNAYKSLFRTRKTAQFLFIALGEFYLYLIVRGEI